MKIPKLFKKAAAFVMAAVTALSIMPATAFAAGDIGTIFFSHTYDSNGNAMRYNSSANIGGYTAGGTGNYKYRMFVDGENAFCIQPGVPLKTGNTLKKASSDTWNALSANQKKAVGLALLYGYQGNRNNLSGSDDEKWLATQTLVWEFVTGCREATGSYNQTSTTVYSLHFGSNYALDGVSISVEEGEFVAVIGTSGSGKSTLLNMIGGLDRPTSGSVTIRGKELLKMKDEELTIFRRRNIGFVFQNYNLLPVLNVYENIVYPIEIDGGKTDTRFVKEIIHTLGLEQKLKNMPNNLSGGQQQRVAIARALATKPAIILADEPTGNLDSKTSMDVILLMQSISRQFHQTTIMITHNEEIAQMADRTIRIEDGKVVSGGVRYAR